MKSVHNSLHSQSKICGQLYHDSRKPPGRVLAKIQGTALRLKRERERERERDRGKQEKRERGRESET